MIYRAFTVSLFLMSFLWATTLPSTTEKVYSRSHPLTSVADEKGSIAMDVPAKSDDTTQPACLQIGQTWISPFDGREMVCVPAGKFLMGAAETDTSAGEDERPQHEVYLDAFWIDKTEVTNADFLRCIDEGACHPEIYDTTITTYIPYAVHPDYQSHPALIFIVDDAIDYCQWAGRRLPTEAEWEKSARGTDGRMYPWGESLDCERANYYLCDNRPEPGPDVPPCGYTSSCQTRNVDSQTAGASPYGLLHMSGNVWEWVSDWYSTDYFTNSPQENPQGPVTGDFRVRKGGGATSLAKDLRASSRASGKGEHYFDGQMGFRCATDTVTP